MVSVVLKCPFCGSEDLRPYGSSNGKKRYAGNNPECSHKTFYAEYTYNGCKPEVKKDIIKWAVDGAGIWATARESGASADRVIKELKKMIEYVNKEYLLSHKKVTIGVEMDKMWSFYHDKRHEILLWRAIDHDMGEVVAFWFGMREQKNLDKLLELLVGTALPREGVYGG
jgi:transposase-like protein